MVYPSAILTSAVLWTPLQLFLMLPMNSPSSKLLQPRKCDEFRASLETRLSDDTLTIEDLSFLVTAGVASPFLGRLMIRYTEDLGILCSQGGPLHVRSLIGGWHHIRPTDETPAALMKALRRTRERLALGIALLDLAGVWSLSDVTQALSDFADVATATALEHALQKQVRRGKLVHTDPTQPLASTSGFFVLGLGKLGGSGLNYSSDIDLIALYDPQRAPLAKGESASDIFVRVTRDMIAILDQRTSDGYVFRVDMRLRPDPGATPVALSVDAAESYYHSAALNWERAAMIKARPIAGDPEAAQDYLNHLSSWVWRRSVDYTALADIAAIKDQVVQHYDQTSQSYAGFDVKLGPGGIREIEFFVQIHQLLHGGRNPDLRDRETMRALAKCRAAGLVSDNHADSLQDAYEFWRALEHRIQMIEDAQSHTIPENEADRLPIAALMGFDSDHDMQQRVEEARCRVSAIYATLFPHDPGQARAWSPGSLQRSLTDAGYSEHSVRLVEGWRLGRYKCLKTDRSRKLLDRCLEDLIAAFSSSPDPDATLSRFDQFLVQLPAGIQLFSMLENNPKLFELLARIMTLSPAIADLLARQPSLWDALMDPGFFGSIEDAEQLRSDLGRRLQGCKSYEDILDDVRRFVAEFRFRIGVHTFEGLQTPIEGNKALSRVADAVFAHLIPAVLREFEQRYGVIKKGHFAVVALGQYGSGQLTPTSDLDLVFTYSVEQFDTLSTGPKSLPPSTYYSKLGQALVTAVTALTKEGRLFEMDTRLRPMGQQGPLAIAFQTMEAYYREEAWVWEKMALTRARILDCPPPVRDELDALLTNPILSRPYDPDLFKAVRDMRQKLRDANPEGQTLDLKHGSGGTIDLEFMLQYLILLHAPKHETLLEADIETALLRLGEADIIDAHAVQKLQAAFAVILTVQTGLRLCLGTHRVTLDSVPASILIFLQQLTHCFTVTALKRKIETARNHIKTAYETYVI